jgi:parallel beta-helix repeat protein
VCIEEEKMAMNAQFYNLCVVAISLLMSTSLACNSEDTSGGFGPAGVDAGAQETGAAGTAGTSGGAGHGGSTATGGSGGSGASAGHAATGGSTAEGGTGGGGPAGTGGGGPAGSGGGGECVGQMYVSPAGNDGADGTTTASAKKTIEAGVGAVPSGGIVCVASGTYHEHDISISKQMTLQGAGSTTTIVDAGGADSVVTIGQSGSGSTVQGFTLSGSNYGIVTASVRDVAIKDNNLTAVNWVGIQNYDSSTNLLISGNTITGTDGAQGMGIGFDDVTGTTVTGNTVTHFFHGILFNKGNTHNIVSYNKVTGNHDGAGIYGIDGSQDMKILNNTVTAYRDGIAVEQLGDGASTGFLIQGNTVEDNLNGIWVALSDSTIDGNKFLRNTNGLDLTGTGNQITNNIFENSSNCDVALTTTSSSDVNTLSNNTYNGSATGGKFYNVGPGKVIGE